MNQEEYAREIRCRIGNRVRDFREKQGLTQKNLATISNVDRTVVNRIEKGEQNVLIDSLIMISLGLGVPLSELFEGVDELS